MPAKRRLLRRLTIEKRDVGLVRDVVLVLGEFQPAERGVPCSSFHLCSGHIARDLSDRFAFQRAGLLWMPG